MNGKLEPKPEKITLDYALQLGWNLTDAVYQQLHLRGCDNYDVQGIYSDGGQVFVIIQDRTSLEFLRCDLEITGQDTVVLGTEMIAVSQTWTPKGPAEPEPVQSLGNDPANASQDPASTLSKPAEPAPAPDPGPAPAGAGNFTETPVEPAAEPAAPAEPPAEPEPTPVEPMAEPAPAPVEPAPDYSAQPEPAASAAEPEPAPAEPEPEPAPVTDFAALSAQVAALQAELATSNEKVATLEGALSVYKAAEAEANEQKKKDLLAAYSAMLTEEEMKPVAEAMANLTVDEMEARLAVTFARKQQAQSYSAPQVQVNINSVPESDDGLPDFMKQAMEIDKQMRGGITLKA